MPDAVGAYEGTMNPYLGAITRHVLHLRDTADTLAVLLAENGKAMDLSAEEAARVLLKLQRLSRKLEGIAGELGGGFDPLPEVIG
jgi:hypothetical protein